MNPFKEYSSKDKIRYKDWKWMSPKPYDKRGVSPYTKARIILMNGTEFEANWFLHNFNRCCLNNEVRRVLSEVRRQEQQQQKRISALKPIDESILETTISYEQLAVDLTANIAQSEPNPLVKAQLDFALLEDFDHLYRFSNLLLMEHGEKGENLVGKYTEITPARPTISEHRHPNDDIKLYINDWQDKLITRLHANIITAAEQQTMNYYMNVGTFYGSDIGRRLFSEIAMIEEQHVSGYGSLVDPSCTMFERWVMHEYIECYLYYSCYQDESDEYIKKIWLEHYEQELTHLKIASEMLYKYEGRNHEQLFVLGADFPELIKLRSNVDYIKGIMKSVRLTALKENFVNIKDLKDNADFFNYQGIVNKNVEKVASHEVIDKFIKQSGEDYRFEKGENVEKTLRDRTKDNTILARTKNA